MDMWSLDLATDKVETTSFGDTNKTYVQGLPDVSGEISGFFNDTNENLYTASRSADGCKLYLYPTSAAPTVYWYGPAWLDFSMEVGVSDAVKVSGTFAANGAWGKKP